MLTKSKRFVFLASSMASGPHICHETGLFMWPRTLNVVSDHVRARMRGSRELVCLHRDFCFR